MDRYEAVVERLASSSRTVMLLGGLDSGKTSLGRAIARRAVAAGRCVAYLDADLGQKTIGPPATISLRLLREEEEMAPERLASPTAVHFVGATSPQGHLLPLVVGAGKLFSRATQEGADLVVVDTSGLVSGVYAQLLKYHKMELLMPDAVVGLQRGEELEPLLGIAQRFFSPEVLALPVNPATSSTSVEERARNREQALRKYFSAPLHRWRVRPSVFMPTLPATFDESRLDRLLVGLSAGTGDDLGIGYLEYSSEEQVLRLRSPVEEAPKALKLGSLQMENGFRLRKVELRALLGTD